MFKKALFIILPSVILLSACSGGSSGKSVLGVTNGSGADAGSSGNSGSSGTPGNKGQTLTVELKEVSNSGQKGTATLEDVGGGKTKVTVTLSNKNDKAQPTHIFTGDCTGPINVQYQLLDIKDGKSETVLDNSLDEIQKAEPLAVTVHPPVADWSGKYVACGNLQ